MRPLLLLLFSTTSMTSTMSKLDISDANYRRSQVDVEMRSPAIAMGDVINKYVVRYRMHPNEVNHFVPAGTLLNQMPVRTDDNVLQDWKAMTALVMDSGERIDSKPCHHRNGQR